MSRGLILGSGLFSLAIAGLHVFGGGPELHVPALNSALDPAWKAAFSTIWHQVTAFLIFNGIFLLMAGRSVHFSRGLVTLIMVQNAAFAVLFFAYGWFRLGTPFVLLQWVLFLPLALLLLLALLRDKASQVA